MLDAVDEARRQIGICNACRYCEGYCAVFPAMTRQRTFADQDLTQLANLCHNCRGCYYACQFTEPHDFALNLPKALAELRHESWKDHAWPGSAARMFDRSGVVITLLLVLGFALFFAAASMLRPEDGDGFYAVLSHATMVAIFLPAFVLPLVSVALSVRGYLRTVGGEKVRFGDLIAAVADAALMKNLRGGHDKGCNFEDEDRFSKMRTYYHQFALYGFILCFAATSLGTIYHYVLAMPAPYPIYSLPKMFGIIGGIMLCVGSGGLALLKLKADKNLGAPNIWGGEMAFVSLLFWVSASGLLLYGATGTALVPLLLPVHLGFVLCFFLVTPYSKMAHGFYRLAALAKDAANRRAAGSS